MSNSDHHCKSDAEYIVNKFYNEIGWETHEGTTEDAKRFEDLRTCASEYVSKCRLRVLRHIPKKGKNIIDMASGPLQYPEYLDYSRGFNKRYCIDLSAKALSEAKKKISDHGVFIQGSFFDAMFEENFFDCAISLHTIYHIDKDTQEAAVRKLLRITKPRRPVIIVYSNPNALVARLILPFRWIRRKWNSRLGKSKEHRNLYFFAHPIDWWNRFSDIADIKIYPWRSLDTRTQKLLIPNNAIGKSILQILFLAEDRFPSFFVNYFQYPMIVLTKK
jgi:ubiquinone/menaquinone biosynthesis C-methylase UbiE